MGYFAASVDTNLQRQIENAANAGRMFSVFTGNYSATAGNAYAGISVFFTARATKVVLISARSFNMTVTNVASYLRLTTSDPNYSGKTISNALGQTLAIKNAFASGGATSGGNLTSATEAISATTGTLWKANLLSTNASLVASEMIANPADYVIINPNVAGGFLLINNAASTNVVTQSLTWVEI
jgi:hypothetical protein